MTTRSDIRHIMRLALPLALAGTATAINGLADGFFLSRHSDVALRAAVPANTLVGGILAFFTAAIGYAGTIQARAHGGKRRAEALATLMAAGILAALSLPILLLLTPLAHAALAAFSPAAELLEAERRLVDIMLRGGVLQLLGIVGLSYFMGQGRTLLAGAALGAGALVKLAATPLLVFGYGPVPSFGIDGAGLAYVFEHLFLALGLLAALLCELPLLRAVPRRHVFGRLVAAGGSLLRHGIPLGLVTVVGYATFFVLTSLLARLEAAAASASSILMAINCPFNALVVGFSQATEIAVGQRRGAGDREGVLSAFRAAVISGLALSALYGVFLLAFGPRLAEVFLPRDAALDTVSFANVIHALVIALAVRVGFEFVSNLFSATLRGLGLTRALTWAGLGTTVLVWLPTTAAAVRFLPTAEALWGVMILTSALGILPRAWIFSRAVSTRRG